MKFTTKLNILFGLAGFAGYAVVKKYCGQRAAYAVGGAMVAIVAYSIYRDGNNKILAQEIANNEN